MMYVRIMNVLDRLSSSAAPSMSTLPDDFTFYAHAGKFDELCGAIAQQARSRQEDVPPSGVYSLGCTLRVPVALKPPADASDSAASASADGTGSAGPPDGVGAEAADTENDADAADAETFTGRALACRCFGGEFASVTCRAVGSGDGAAAVSTVRWPGGPVRLVPAGALRAPAPPVPAAEPPVSDEKRAMQRSTDELVDELWKLLRLDEPLRTVTGLIVIAGRTGSGKSVIARRFAERYMQRCVAEARGRRPHLLTYEDPIEHRFAASPKDAVARLGYDYTPREKPVDVHSLQDATMDALRQTPSLFFVGETRETEDWKALLRFAGTGHLAITTGHAGSLVETMAQIVQAMQVGNPAERSGVAGRIAALVHIRPHWVDNSDPRRKVLIPAFWARTPRSISSFTAEGLASMLPNQGRGRGPGRGGDAPDDPDHQPPGSYGRAHAVKSLRYLQGIPELKRKSIEWDLRGE